MNTLQAMRSEIENQGWPGFPHNERCLVGLQFEKALPIAVKQAKAHLPVFERLEPEIKWPARLIEVVHQHRPLKEIRRFPRYQEVASYDSRAYVDGLQDIISANVAVRESEPELGIEYLSRATSLFVTARHFHFWTTQQPQLTSFFYIADDADLDGMLARLSFARDPIVVAYVRAIWLEILDEIERS